jgi:DNA invertase Pin-like site-specific DNA recombinase
MAWVIDRLGRSLSDLLDTIQDLEACGVDLYSRPAGHRYDNAMGKLVFQIAGAFAEFERTMIRQSGRQACRRARREARRPKIDKATERKARKQFAKGMGILKLAKSLEIDRTKGKGHPSF